MSSSGDFLRSLVALMTEFDGLGDDTALRSRSVRPSTELLTRSSDCCCDPIDRHLDVRAPRRRISARRMPVMPRICSRSTSCVSPASGLTSASFRARLFPDALLAVRRGHRGLRSPTQLVGVRSQLASAFARGFAAATRIAGDGARAQGRRPAQEAHRTDH